MNAHTVTRWRPSVWQGLLAAIFSLGLYSAWVRYTQGLGAATNLSDELPWGLWIGFDLLVGVGLAAGGFVVAATVHLFRMERYEPIARPAVLTAFLGYLLVIVALLFDLGQPHRIWHPLVMWNPHSVMFEVAWCVMLYTAVLALEFSPLVFERLRMKRPLKLIRTVYVPVVILGVLLSTLHQSSLGSLYVIVPDKLHGLWYTPLLPVFFFLSAIAGGLAMTIFESFMSHRGFGKRLEADLLQGLGRVIAVVLAVYAVWRAQDLAARDNLVLAFALTPESVLFWGEVGLGVLLPMALLVVPRVRRSERGLLFAALLTLMGFIINRLNVAVTGMAASTGTTYIPSWMEFAVTASMVAGGFVLFALAVKYLPVFPAEGPLAGGGRRQTRSLPALSQGLLVGLWLLLLVGVAGVSYSLARNGAPPPPEQPESALPAAAEHLDRLPPPYTFPSSEDSPGPVTFDHTTHVDAASPGCRTCHQGAFRITAPGQPMEGALTYEAVHEGALCASCHDGSRAFAVEEGCEICHSM